MNDTKRHLPVLIIGAGPAGIAAAIQLKRSSIDAIILEQGLPGGLLRNARLVENYPGFPSGITGPELADRMLSQAMAHHVAIVPESVHMCSWDSKQRLFQVFSYSGVRITRHLVVASGTQPIRLPDSTISGDAADRIFYEIASLPADLAGRSGLRVAVIGAGDAGFDYAFNLSSRHAVTLFNRSETPRCIPVLWERWLASRPFQIIQESQITCIRPEQDALTLEWIAASPDNRTGETLTIRPRISIPEARQDQFDFAVVAIGRQPSLDFLDQRIQDRQEAAGNVYFIGDVKNGIFRQTAMAVGDGIRAAMEIADSLKSEPRHR